MKPIILAFDTSSSACTVALQAKGEIYFEHEIQPRRHNELLLPMIQSLLHKAQIGFDDLEAIAFGAGPGSFVGVRIAAAVVQGLAFAANKPVIRLSSLQIMAQTAHHDHRYTQVQVAIDARMQQAYLGRYELQNDLMLPVEADSIQPINQLSINEGYTAIGDAWQGDRLDILPHAIDMLPLAEHYYVKGEVVKAEQALPIYLDEAKQWKKLSF